MWRQLHSLSNYRSPFTSYEWFSALCQHILMKDPAVFILTDEDRPVGVVPATVENETLRFLTDERITDLTDMICLSGYEEEACTTIASYITSRKLHIDLAPLEKNSPLVKYLPLLLDNVEVQNADPCPLITLPDSWADYVSRLNSKRRHELKRKLRKGQEIEIHETGSTGIKKLFALMSISDINKSTFLTETIQTFINKIAELFHSRKWLRLRVSYFKTRPIGVLFSFRIENNIYLYNSGFDPAFSNLSPGIVSIARDIESAIMEGCTHYDFLRGDEAYKLQLGASIRHTVRIYA